MRPARVADSVGARLLHARLTRLETGASTRIPGFLARRLADPSASNSYRSGLIRALQELRLRGTAELVARRSEFYRELFAESGLRAQDIRVASDLEVLPFTSAADIRRPERFLCVPSDEVARVFETSGTTREPKRIFFSARDFDRMVNLPALILRERMAKTSAGRRMTCLIAHGHGRHVLNGPPREVVERAGGEAITPGQPEPSEALEILARVRPDAIMTSPSYLAAVTREASGAGVRMEIPHILLDGQVSTAAQRALFAEYWGARVVNGYGLSEIPGCALGRHGCDALHLNEIQVLTEVVDPHSGEPSDEGELVFTTLTREAMPLLRYRSGDRGRWARCSCGSPVPAIVVEGRIDDTVVLAATNVRLPLVADEIARKPWSNGHLDVTIDHVDHVDRLTLRVGVEQGVAPPAADAVERVLLGLFPDLVGDRQARALELVIHAKEGLDLGDKSLRVRDLRG